MALRVFQISEESSGGGSSCCSVTKESRGFYLYGNELGCMAGPCKTVNEALNASGFQFGMQAWEIRCYVPAKELADILASPAFILENAERVVINNIVAPSCTVSAIVGCHNRWQHGRIREMTIILGPPSAAEIRQRIEKCHQETGTPKDELWVEVVHLALRDLNARSAPEEPSTIDKLFSDFVKAPVAVHDLFVTYTLLSEFRHPALMFYPDKIADGTGWPFEFDWSNPQVQQALGSIFSLLLESEWARVSTKHET